MGRKCTIPSFLLIRKPFEAMHGRDCERHDYEYFAPISVGRWLRSDLRFILRTWSRSLYYLFACVLCLVLIPLLPLISWLWYFDVWQKLGFKDNP
jgi:hypothetical protein